MFHFKIHKIMATGINWGQSDCSGSVRELFNFKLDILFYKHQMQASGPVLDL